MAQNENGKRMMNAFLIAVLTVLSSVALAAIPWAYTTGSRLTAIETLLKTQQGHVREFTDISNRVLKLEFKVEKLGEGE